MNKILLPLMLVVLLAGCAGQRETYALLPDASGKTGTLTVLDKSGGGQVVLTQPYATAASSGGKVSIVEQNKDGVREQFADALAAQPEQAKAFTLYFLDARDELTPESKAELRKTLPEIARRPVPDVVVVGHTDRVGKVEDNDRLALKRALRIREELVAIGVPVENIQLSGRGEREPLVPTADEVAEPRNRRVEVLVR